MAASSLERLTLTPVVGADEDLNKVPRLPRWTRQELLVLIQGKRVAENRVRRGRSAVLAFGSSSQVEPKWSSVSSYCKRHGVNRGPVQCRKRWSNLAGDFKKIKEWESQIKEEADSFWVMRNDLRRERKLPGFFDREVYDILDAPPPAGLALSAHAEAEAEAAAEAAKATTEVVFDSGRTAAAEDGLFSDDATASPQKLDKTTTTTTTPVSATQYEPPPPAAADNKGSSPAAGPSPETYQGKKRKRPKATEEEEEEDDDDDDDEETSLHKQLIEAMETNGRLLTSQLEIHNANSHLDREQRKDYANGLFAVLNKLADAMVRIADKL